VLKSHSLRHPSLDELRMARPSSRTPLISAHALVVRSEGCPA
jgi:hypothetical protein